MLVIFVPRACNHMPVRLYPELPTRCDSGGFRVVAVAECCMRALHSPPTPRACIWALLFAHLLLCSALRSDVELIC